MNDGTEDGLIDRVNDGLCNPKQTSVSGLLRFLAVTDSFENGQVTIIVEIPVGVTAVQVKFACENI
jgi:hypothetical protein